MADTYRVTMRNIRGDLTEEAVDPRVPADQLDFYLTDARTRWADVTAEPNNTKE